MPKSAAPTIPHVRDVARPFRAGSGPVGVLVSHGFTGSVQSIRPWAAALAAPGDGWEGARVVAPRLPGHGTSWRDLARTRWWDWYNAVDDAYEELAGQCERVFVAGLSMGGALALRLAQRRDVAGVMLVNPAIATRDRRVPFAARLHRLLPAQPGIASDIANPVSIEAGYDKFSVTSLATMTHLWSEVRADLTSVTAPTLLFTSDQDHVVDDLTAEILRRDLGNLTCVALPRSYHVATLDYDAEVIERESRSFIQRVVAG